MRAIKSVQKSLATEFYGACSSEGNKVACCKRFDVIKTERLLAFLPLWSTNEKKITGVLCMGSSISDTIYS